MCWIKYKYKKVLEIQPTEFYRKYYYVETDRYIYIYILSKSFLLVAVQIIEYFPEIKTIIKAMVILALNNAHLKHTFKWLPGK